MQSVTLIQQALDARLGTVSGVTASGTGQNFWPENQTIPTAAIQNPKGLLMLRANLAPARTTTETLGSNGYVKQQGFYAIDVFSVTNTGYVAASQLIDAVMAAFPRGLNLTLPNGDILTLDGVSQMPISAYGAWDQNKWYGRQVQVFYFCYTQP